MEVNINSNCMIHNYGMEYESALLPAFVIG